MKKYYCVMLGRESVYASEGFACHVIGVDFEITQDLTDCLSDDLHLFKRKFIPVFLSAHPNKTRIGAGLACGALWTVSKGIHNGDIVLCPDGAGRYRVAEVSGGYFYVPGNVLPHRRPVHWLGTSINHADMSDALKKSTGSISTVSHITQYEAEIEKLIGGITATALYPTDDSTDESIENPIAFALEKHLEDFLVQNWAQAELAQGYDIFEEEGEKVGQQYPTDIGKLDILAIKKDRTELLVVELKKGRSSDAVIGQLLRYMGYVQQELAEPNQTVKGVIIALEDDQRIKWALAMTPNIDFYLYQISFKLIKV